MAYYTNSTSLEYFVRIDGTKYVLATKNVSPTDTWFTAPRGQTGKGFTVLPGLRRESIRFRCEAYPGEVWPETSSMDIEFVDEDGTLKSYLKSFEGLNHTELTAGTDDDDTTISVKDTSAFSIANDLYIGIETIKNVSRTPTTFTTCTRGAYNSKAIEHTYDDGAHPPCIPDVTDGPEDYRGRRVTIFAAEVINGVLQSTEKMWVGYVDGFVSLSGDTWTIPCAHMIKAFTNGNVFSSIPQARIRGYNIPNYIGEKWGSFTVFGDVSGYETFDIVTEDSVQFFESIDEIVYAIQQNVDFAASDWRIALVNGYVELYYEGTDTLFFPCMAHTVQFDDPNANMANAATLLTIMGFHIEMYNLHDLLGYEYFRAASRPFSSFAPLNPWGEYDLKLQLRSGEAQYFVESDVNIDGVPIPLRVTDIDIVTDILTVAPVNGVIQVPNCVYSIHPSPAPSVVQSWAASDLSLEELIRILWAGQLYGDSADLSYTLPSRWLAEPCMDDDDVDWTALRSLVRDGSPYHMTRVEYDITKPQQIGEIVTGHLLVCGIYAYIKRDGTVGWKRCEVPSPVESSNTLDGASIDAERAPSIATRIGRDRLITSVHMKIHGHFTQTEKSVFVADQRSIQRYGNRFARNVLDPVANAAASAVEVDIWANNPGIFDDNEIRECYARHLGNTILAFHAKPRTYVRLPVTPSERYLEIGAALELTSEWVFDRLTGTDGVEDKLAMVVGYETTEETGNRTDWVTLVLIDDGLGGIAPAAHSTSNAPGGSGERVFTFADTTLYKRDDDDSDLDYFEIGDVVFGYELDNTSWASNVTFDGVITAKTSSTITVYFYTTPSSWSNDYILTFGLYSDCPSEQQAEYWVWLADDADNQIEDLREAYRWA